MAAVMSALLETFSNWKLPSTTGFLESTILDPTQVGQVHGDDTHPTGANISSGQHACASGLHMNFDVSHARTGVRPNVRALKLTVA